MKNNEILIIDFNHTIEKPEKNTILKVYSPLNLNSAPKIYFGNHFVRMKISVTSEGQNPSMFLIDEYDT